MKQPSRKPDRWNPMPVAQYLLVAVFIGNRIRPVEYDKVLLPVIVLICVIEWISLYSSRGDQ